MTELNKWVEEERARQARALKWGKKATVGGHIVVEQRPQATATERRTWTRDALISALYMLIDMCGTGHSIAWKPIGRITGHCTIAIGAPPQSLIDLCIDSGVPIVDLSVPGFSLVEQSRLLDYDTGNHPEYGGDLDRFLDACRAAGASITLAAVISRRDNRVHTQREQSSDWTLYA